MKFLIVCLLALSVSAVAESTPKFKFFDRVSIDSGFYKGREGVLLSVICLERGGCKYSVKDFDMNMVYENVLEKDIKLR